MKRKRKPITSIPWTPFERAAVDADKAAALTVAHGGVMPLLFLNSRYQVNVVAFDHPTFGPTAHLSIKARDKSASHDWRDFQRIKNELCGDETEAIELYPAESRLVDGANQYHLWVFRSYRVPIGFEERLVVDGGRSRHGAVQRDFEPGMRPADCLPGDALDRATDKLLRAVGAGGAIEK